RWSRRPSMQTDLTRRSYGRLPILILLMTLVILIIGAVALHYVENRLVATTGESLALAAADIADMLDRLLFERYSDIPMMARARVFQGRDRAAMTDYLNWVQKNYRVYRWLGVLDASRGIIAATAAIRTFQVQRGPTGKIEYQIMTRDGDLLVDSLMHQEMQVNLKLMALPSALLSASALPGYIEEQHVRRKVPVVTGYSGTEGYGDFTGLHWAVLVRMDRSDILAPIRAVLQNLALAGALIVLPLLGFLLWTSGRLQAEYQRALEESARAMAAETSLRLRDRAIAETSNGVLIIDPHQPDNPIIYANPAFERITGYRMDEVLGRNCRFLQGPDTDSATVAVMRQAIAEQRDCQVVILNYRKDGTSFWSELTVSPVHDDGGQVTHFVGVLADITARKEAEQAIERLSRQNELILNAAGEGIYGLDLQGKTTFVNTAAERMLGWRDEELIGQPMHQIMHHTKQDGTPYPEEECPIYASFQDGMI